MVEIQEVSSRSIEAGGIGISDYSADLRALISVDKPSRPTPYDDLSLDFIMLGIAHNTTQNKTFTHTDWGEDMDFYLTNVHLWMLTPDWLYPTYDVLYKNYDQQFLIKIENGVTSEPIYIKTFTAMDKNVTGYTVNSLGYHIFASTKSLFQMKRIESNESVKVTVHNWTGYWMYCYIYISGIPVP